MFVNTDRISQKDIGLGIVVVFTLVLINEVNLIISVKKSKKAKDIDNHEHKRVAQYLENNKMKYIYKPKSEKKYDFLLSEYETYLKIIDQDAKGEEERLRKYAKKQDDRLIVLPSDKLKSNSLMHGSIMKRLSLEVKER